MQRLTLVVTLLLATSTPANEAEIAALTERLNDLATWLESADDELRAKRQVLAQFDATIRRHGEERRRLAGSLATAADELGDITARIESLEASRQRAADELNAFLVAIHRGGITVPLKRLLSERDPSEFDRQARYERVLLEAQQARLDTYQATLARLDAARALESAKQDEVANHRTTLDRTIVALEAQRIEREAVIAALSASIVDKTDERERLLADRSRLQTLLDELPRSREFIVPSSGSAWPIDGELLRQFGEQRMGQLRWRGVYFSAPSGAAVRAAAGGTVVFADHLRGFGLLTILDHGDEQLTLYGYTDTLFKRAGEPVRAGETIATAGQSGGQADIGLYFEVRDAGTSIDPLAWLRSRGISPD